MSPGAAPRPRPAARPARPLRLAFLAAATLARLTPAQSTPPPATAPATRPAVPVALAAAQARAWVGQPDREETLDAFAPAAAVHARRYRTPRPLRAWIVQLDLAAPGVRSIVTEPAEPTDGAEPGEVRCADTLQFARQRGAQLAVNTSAFAPFRPHAGLPMDVVGLAAADGRVYSPPERDLGALFLFRDGRAALRGPPLEAGGAWHIVPGFRMLLDDERLVVTQAEADTKFGGLNPRTAVGVDRAGRTLWIVVVDGRQPGVSEGLTLVELACLLASLGAWDALNLDGGGSSTLVLERRDGTHAVVNTPVGRGPPGSLRQVANNLGFSLPGTGLPARPGPPESLRDAVIRLAAGRRGHGFDAAGDGVRQDIVYAGQTVLRGGPGSHDRGATLELFLDACRALRSSADPATAPSCWLEDWPLDRFIAFQQAWYGLDAAAASPVLPDDVRAVVAEQRLAAVLPWSGLAAAVPDCRLLQRGDFVQFWRRDGSSQAALFWARDRDEAGRERLWYWSSRPAVRHFRTPPQGGREPGPGGDEAGAAGEGLDWEYIGDEIDPARIYGVSLVDRPAHGSAGGRRAPVGADSRSAAWTSGGVRVGGARSCGRCAAWD